MRIFRFSLIVFFISLQLKAADIIVPLHDEAFDNENNVLDSEDLDSIFNAIKNLFGGDKKDSIESNVKDSKNIESTPLKDSIESKSQDSKIDSKNIESKMPLKDTNIESKTQKKDSIESKLQDSHTQTQDKTKQDSIESKTHLEDSKDSIESKSPKEKDSRKKDSKKPHHIESKPHKKDSKKHHEIESKKKDSNKTESKNDQNDRDRSISLHYINGYMRHSHFNILLNGAALEYNSLLLNKPHLDIVLTYQLNFSHASLNPDRLSSNNWADSNNGTNNGSESIGGLNTESTLNKSLIFGTFATLDVLFNQSQKGFHAASFDFGYSVGFGGRSSGANGTLIESRGASQFDEHSLLLNAEYGYGFVYGIYTILPYIRVESYIFFPNLRARSNFKRHTDGGMNAILGVKNVWDSKWAEFGLEFGVLSDLNLSGDSIGILGNGALVYDSDGMSNGVFGQLSLGILRYKHFHLLASTNIGYMLSYFELNIQSDLSLMWRF
ncbi:hypothetical protein DCO58_00380 [Helicobacter saguini]|uniref:Autotransporter domain-containing protein n=1 Tax=Helicobacter saguini TaxID=1548018 RepID=A0A347VQU8_9HELI|nr:hypothetical protein [Helicobacter saguini]MWV63151.1 hypothetical protein [Helicobacter saguini]MWV66179.1 hypothetical protein [Helicobacter saguini]MWV68528.1 hypothetical protein [Helicobacter saguini]MWV71917.1 hypothetical protein [Helicobacter saguini]TLD95930.1 hypothetical protein LS64_000775 [Helicobacter saguini]